MKNIFVDLGAYNGDSIKEFLNIGKSKPSQSFLENVTLPVDPSLFEIYAFEPNPKFKDCFNEFNNVTFSNKVALTYDGMATFAIDQTNDPLGSTAESSKVSIYDTMPHEEIECFDFSNWIKQFSKDYVIVKMDIEGSEFPILYKMISEGTHKIMSKLWVEMHPNKARSYTTTDSINLVERLRQDIEVEYWH